MKPIFSYRGILVMWLALVGGPWATLATSEAATAERPNSYIDDRAWMTAPWTSDDQPFLQAEREVDELLRLKHDPQELASAYEARALGDMSDAVALYRWAYATFRIDPPLDYVVSHINYAISKARWAGVYEALNRPLAPMEYIYSVPKLAERYRQGQLQPLRSYRYSRLVFLVAISTDYRRIQDREMLDLGRLGDRLLKRNPADTLVKMYCARAYCNEWFVKGRAKPMDYAKALRYAQQLVSANSKNRDYLVLLAIAQGRNWNFFKDDKGVDAMIGTYQKYLRLAPPNARYRKKVLASIDTMRGAKKFAAQLRAKKKAKNAVRQKL